MNRLPAVRKRTGVDQEWGNVSLGKKGVSQTSTQREKSEGFAKHRVKM